MKFPVFRRADFKAALHALLPRGRVWPREPGTAQDKVLDGLAAVYERQARAAVRLLIDAFPRTTAQLMREWEQTLGLPDACTGPAVGLEERRLRIVQKLVDTGGQSRPYFIALARALGYPGVTITEYAPFRAGSRCGSALNGNGWQHAWLVNIPGDAGFAYFTAGSGAGERLRVWGAALLECVIRRAAPAHTVVFFAYGLPYPDEDWGWVDLPVGESEDWGWIGMPTGASEDWGTLDGPGT